MFKEIIDYIRMIGLRHKAVNYSKYQSRIITNAQNNNGYLQFNIEDNSFAQYLITRDIVTLKMNVDIIGKPDTNNDILAIQDMCYQVGNEVIAYIGRDESFKQFLSVYDYDFLFLSHFTDDDSAGVRMGLVIAMPSPVNLCTLDDNFVENAEFKEEATEPEIPMNYPKAEIKRIKLNL